MLRLFLACSCLVEYEILKAAVLLFFNARIGYESHGPIVMPVIISSKCGAYGFFDYEFTIMFFFFEDTSLRLTISISVLVPSDALEIP